MTAQDIEKGKALEAALQFVRAVHGMQAIEKISDEESLTDIVCADMQGRLHFLSVDFDVGKFPDEPTVTAQIRRKLESEVVDFLEKRQDFIDCAIHFDRVSLAILEDERAIVRVHHNYASYI